MRDVLRVHAAAVRRQPQSETDLRRQLAGHVPTTCDADVRTAGRHYLTPVVEDKDIYLAQKQQ